MLNNIGFILLWLLLCRNQKPFTIDGWITVFGLTLACGSTLQYYMENL